MIVLLYNIIILFSTLFCCLAVKAKQGRMYLYQKLDKLTKQEIIQKNKELFHHFLKGHSHVLQSYTWKTDNILYAFWLIRIPFSLLFQDSFVLIIPFRNCWMTCQKGQVVLAMQLGKLLMQFSVLSDWKIAVLGSSTTR